LQIVGRVNNASWAVPPESSLKKEQKDDKQLSIWEYNKGGEGGWGLSHDGTIPRVRGYAATNKDGL